MKGKSKCQSIYFRIIQTDKEMDGVGIISKTEYSLISVGSEIGCIVNLRKNKIEKEILGNPKWKLTGTRQK
jgi:hypothetical protein